MTNVLLIIQLLVAIALVAVILLQQSEGGALGVGGGAGGGMMSGRGAANVLTRTTMILGALFIGNSILLAIVVGVNSEGQSVFERSADDVLPSIPVDEEPAAGIPTDG
ncbi:MAG: preprotein translocase subunit SecG [Maricaulis sp.]|jgi:preprotein translocase subunit SecG